MSISVVMTTYNGAERLHTQLVTLRDQTLKPDEILIFDDCSTDKSVEIIRNFIYENQLYEWTLIQNDHNKGWKQNFADGINTVRGDIIFLADQDDEWKLNKIEIMTEILSSNDHIKVLASNYDVRYEKNARHIRSWMLKPYGKGRVEQVQLNGMTFEPLRPGCTYAFKNDIIPTFNAVWKPDDAHDRIIWDTALLEGTLYILNEKTLTQIRYGGNNTPANQRTGSGRIDVIRYRCELAERLMKVIQKKESIEWLKEYIKIAESREKAMKNASLVSLANLSKDRGYMPLPISWVLDIASVIQSKIKLAKVCQHKIH